jgi:hypothetical protein
MWKYTDVSEEPATPKGSYRPEDTNLLSHCYETLETHDFGKINVPLCCYRSWFVKSLKPTGHVMHQKFNIQQLYVLPTLYLCVLYLSENKQRLVPLTA